MKHFIKKNHLILWGVIILFIISAVIPQLKFISYPFTWLTKAFGLLIALQFLYLFGLSLLGFKKPKRDYPLLPDQAKFLILIAAHNEEAVIENTLVDLRNLNYDPKLYKIIVVNDNSTDRTGEICDKCGVEHVDTIKKVFPREGVGKPGGIQYALRALGFEKLTKQYDLLFILDADNHVDYDILKEINSQWITFKKPEAIQSYLGVKNWKTILAAGYAINYWTTNRFFQLAKYRLHLPASIGGTGFAVRIDWLIWNGGFKYKSLTEDLEMEIQIVEDRGRILWNNFAKIYDEKPDKLKVAMIQRYRWSKGHWFVALTNYRKLLVNFFRNGRFSNIDQIMYLFSMAQVVQYLIFILALIISLFSKSFSAPIISEFFKSLIPNTGFAIFFGLYQFIVLPTYAMIFDSPEKNFFKFVILGLPYYSVTYLVDQFWGLVNWKQQGTWVRTPHDKNLKIKESQKSNKLIIKDEKTHKVANLDKS